MFKEIYENLWALPNVWADFKNSAKFILGYYNHGYLYYDLLMVFYLFP